jgi:hypothetical protein
MMSGMPLLTHYRSVSTPKPWQRDTETPLDLGLVLDLDCLYHWTHHRLRSKPYVNLGQSFPRHTASVFGPLEHSCRIYSLLALASLAQRPMCPRVSSVRLSIA